MPGVVIETRRHRSPAQEEAMMDAVHSALVATFKIPPQDRAVRLVADQPHRFACPPNKASPESFTVVTIDAFSGRSLDAKRSLYRAIVDNLEPLGIPKDHVTILIREAPPSDWGIRGGQAACDIDLGFRIDA